MNKKGIGAGGLLQVLFTGMATAIVGVLIVMMVTGGGFIIPFLKIPWYVWTGLLLLLLAFLFRK